MAPDLVDLDKLDPLPVAVRIAGTTFKVPGAAPLSWLFRFRQLEENLSEDATEVDFVETVRDMIADLIDIEQPGKRTAAIAALDKKSPVVVLQAIRAIYAGQAEDESPEERPTRGASKTTRKPSSRSSAARRAARNP